MILESLKLVQHYVKAEQDKHRGTTSGTAGRLQRSVLAFRLGKCFIICSKCYCSVICMGKLSVNAMPRPICENSEKTSKISSPLLCSLENSAFLHTTERSVQHREGAYCILPSKAEHPSRAVWCECHPRGPSRVGVKPGELQVANATSWQCDMWRSPRKVTKQTVVPKIYDPI